MMKSDSELEKLAERLRRGSVGNADVAEFIRLVSGEDRLDVLKAALRLNYEYAGPILERIIEILPRDAKAHLSLALWKYMNGLDDQALEFLEEARQLAPHDCDVLRADVWFSFSRGPEESLEKCRLLLETFPHDQWAADVKKKICTDGELRELGSPEWSNPWQDLINGVQPTGDRP